VKRIIEIDFFRGIAILLMMIFHTVFNLSYFFGLNLEYARGFWYYEGKLSAGLAPTSAKGPQKEGLRSSPSACCSQP